MKPTMSAVEAAKELRRNGFPITLDRFCDDLDAGEYPFARLISKGPTGRRLFRIYRVDFDAWLEKMMPKAGDTP